MHAVSGASYGGPPQQKMSNLFDAIDTSGSGSISQAQFDQAFATKNPPLVFQQQGSEAIFSKLDPSGSGTVSKQDFVSTMTGLMQSLRSGAAAPAMAKPADGVQASLNALNALGSKPVSANAAAGSIVSLKA